MSFFVNVPLQTNKQIKNFCAHKDERGYPVNVSSNKAIKKKILFFALPGFCVFSERRQLKGVYKIFLQENKVKLYHNCHNNSSLNEWCFAFLKKKKNQKNTSTFHEHK
jgi:hypothetical protein